MSPSLVANILRTAGEHISKISLSTKRQCDSYCYSNSPKQFLPAKTETADLKDKIADIQKEIILLKTDVNQFIDDNYVDFLAKVEKDTILIQTADKLVKTMRGLKNRIEDQVKHR